MATHYMRRLFAFKEPAIYSIKWNPDDEK